MRDYVPQHKPDVSSKLKIFPIVVFCIFVYSMFSILTVVYLATVNPISEGMVSYGLLFLFLGAWSGYLLRRM